MTRAEGVDDIDLRAAGGSVGRIHRRGRWEDTQTALLWLPGMFDNSETRTTSADDDVRVRLADEQVALAELDYPSHLTPRPAEVARVRTDHLLSLVDQAVRRLTALSPGVAVTVIGHSMGAKLALLSCLRNSTIRRAVIIDGWLIGVPEAVPRRASPPVVELFGRGSRFKEMCADIARNDQSVSTRKFYRFALRLLEQRGMLGEEAVAAADEDPALRERMFRYLSRLDPFWSGEQKDEMSRLAGTGPAAFTERWHLRRKAPLEILAINSASRDEWYDEATGLTLDAMDRAVKDSVAKDRVRVAARGHLDVLFGKGSGLELGDIIMEWIGRGGS